MAAGSVGLALASYIPPVGLASVPALLLADAYELPHVRAEARGTIVGITRGTTRAHIARAALEAMAYGTADVLRAMEKDAGVRTEKLTVDGGGSQNDWLMQFQADMVQVPVQRPAMVETTALGAAGLAGIAAGVWTTAEEFVGSRPEPESSVQHRPRRAEMDGSTAPETSFVLETDQVPEFCCGSWYAISFKRSGLVKSITSTPPLKMSPSARHTRARASEPSTSSRHAISSLKAGVVR